MTTKPKSTTTYAKAVYLEFYREKGEKQASTFQVIMYPDYADTESGVQYVKHGYFHRQLTEATPKRPWSKVTIHGLPTRSTFVDQSGETVLSPVTVEENAKIHDTLDNVMDSLWRQLERAEFKLRNRPFTIEVSNVDMEEIAKGKTPYAIIRRITRSREALKFPEALV